MIGMIPEGLILLTSVVFAVSVIRLSKYKTLVQDLYCTESLARVDVLCLDKTGTITEGTMQVDEIIPLEGCTEAEMAEALTALVGALSDDNPTYNAVKAQFSGETLWRAGAVVPFSSARKWSGAVFEGRGTYVMGAGEFILHERFDALRAQTEAYAARGERVLLLARADGVFAEDKSLPADVRPVGLIAISDKIRAEAPQTLRYFAEQGVTLKVISGDNAVTVSNIAQKAGLADAENYCDATTLQTEADISAAIERHTVFGRVTPQQKLQFVKALKANGHTVAMTGDGVNDVLALKAFVSALTIGAPSFILALEPNSDRIRGNFLTNVLKKSFPSALTMILGVLFLCLFQQQLGLTQEQVSTLSVLVAFTVGFMLMFKLCVPFNALRGALFGTMMLAFILGYILFMDIFSLVPLTAAMLFVLIPLLLVLIVFMVLSNHFMEHIAEKHADRFFASDLFRRLHGSEKKRRDV